MQSSAHGNLTLEQLRKRAARAQKDPNAWIALGEALAKVGAHADAVPAFSKALELMPANDQIWLAIGNQQFALQDFPAALNSFVQALQLNPVSFHAKNSLGILLKLLGQLELAESILLEAISIKPDFPEAHNTLGNLYREMGRLDAAEEHFRQSMRLGNDSAAVWNNLGLLLKDQRRFNEALQCFDSALTKPDTNPNIGFNRAIVLLKSGQRRAGLDAYEQRWMLPELQTKRKAYDKRLPYWQGESLSGKHILLWCEQGLGDALQMLRYVPYLRTRYPDVRITLHLDPSLLRFLQGQSLADKVLSSKDPIPKADFHFSLLSFPTRFFGAADAMPVECPYLCSLPVWGDAWRGKLQKEAGKRYLGLIWETGKVGVGQLDFERQRRSLSDEGLTALVHGAPQDIVFVSLQPGGSEQLARLGLDIQDLGADIRDFADTAAALSLLDGLVTVDTAGAHLAGALNVPTLTMMSYHGGNLFPAEGPAMPWYPGMQLVWQAAAGDWISVVGQVHRQLFVHPFN